VSTWRVAALAIALVFAGCSRNKGPWVERLEVDAFEGGDVISLSQAELRAMLVSRLEGAKFRIASESQKPPEGLKPWRLDFAAGLSEPDLETGQSQVAVALDVRHPGEADAIALTERKQVKADGKDVETMQSGIRAALEDCMGKAVREAAALIALDEASADTLWDKRRDGDAAVRDAALRLLVRAKDPRVADELIARLKTDDFEELHAVMALLVELKAPSTVNPLIEAARQRGPVFTREVVFAVATIGGPDAEAYLDFVASGHDDELVRQSAAQALKELRSRKPQPPPEGTTP